MTEAPSDRFIAKPAPIHRLDITQPFATLSKFEQIYAHHMSRASWHGTRIILRQTSAEAEVIFDFIISLSKSCQGNWEKLRQDLSIEKTDMDGFLDYAACFLSNIGNYHYGSGDQKFIPNVSTEAWDKICGSALPVEAKNAAMAIPPYNLGFPSEHSQSAYYPGPNHPVRDEIANISRFMERKGIFPENTRIRKDRLSNGDVVYTVLQASITGGNSSEILGSTELPVLLERGDHSGQLSKICEELLLASEFAASDVQRQTLLLYIKSFDTGDLNTYRDALRCWVRDFAPRVEHTIGFVETYRDPYGSRAEFEGLVAISNPEETKVLQNLVRYSDKFIRRLPWCLNFQENEGKGPFEKSLFQPPDFSSIHVLAYCSSIIFAGINLPNYNDIRQECGFKNVIIANRMTAESSNITPAAFIAADEAEFFQKHRFPASYIWVVLHELLGHGTGKVLCQLEDGSFNFDHENPPINPVTKQPLANWYLAGQTWGGQFEELATTVEECRAELVGAYLMDDKDLLALFGFTNSSEITADDLTYSTYMQLATKGLRGLQNFNIDTETWGQAHSRANFAILRCLLEDGEGCIRVDFDEQNLKLTVKVDRARILPHGKTALGRMLLRLHIYRSTADVASCKHYYSKLSCVEGRYLEWRKAVVAAKLPKWVYVHANTFLEDGLVRLEEYEGTPAGVIQSWVEREV